MLGDFFSENLSSEITSKSIHTNTEKNTEEFLTDSVKSADLNLYEIREQSLSFNPPHGNPDYTHGYFQ